jgi:hypothetical protein
MKVAAWSIGCAITAMLLVSGCPGARAQASPPPAYQPPSPSLYTLDVIAQHEKTTAILPKLAKTDFHVTDNGQDVPIVQFGSGAHFSVAPITLWLVLKCNGFAPPDFDSGFMKGKTQYLRPALDHLDKTDEVGVAHWCGDGAAVIDQMPGHDPDGAIAALDNLLKQKSVEGSNRLWVTGMRKMVEMVLENMRTADPHRVPVFVFLNGDAGSAFTTEADDILRNLWAGPAIVFGLSNGGYHYDPSHMVEGGKVYFQIHYLAQQTGGQFYTSPDWKEVTKALGYILVQVHFRYALSFEPTERDGKQHELKVELTPEGERQNADAQLRYRPEYIPVPLSGTGH